MLPAKGRICVQYRAMSITPETFPVADVLFPADPRKGASRVAAICEELAAAGINLLYLTCRSGAGQVLHESSLEPNPYGWDVLAAFCREAPPRGIALHAGIALFGDGAGRRPQWHARGKIGRTRSVQSWMCPARPEVQEYFRDLILEWIEGYPVNGIHFDYIRYIDEPCYCLYHRSEFQRLCGADPLELTAEHPLWAAWCEFNVQTIHDLVRWTAGQARRFGQQVSAAVCAGTGNPALAGEIGRWEEWCRSCAFGPAEGQHPACRGCGKEFARFQRWADWAEQRWIDLLTPVPDGAEALAAFRQRLQTALTLAAGVPVVAGIGLGQAGEDGDLQAVARQAAVARELGAAGACLLEYRRWLRAGAARPGEWLRVWR